MKLLITGGHITPALAVVDECRQRDVDIVFVGRAYSYDKSVKTMEAKMIDKRGLPFLHLEAGRLSRNLNLQSLKHLITIPLGFVNSYAVLKKEKPDKILTFGGYIGLPIAVAGWLQGIPVFIHEQVMCPGITSRIISKFAKQVFISFKESAIFFSPNKTILTGNPLRKSIHVKSRLKFKVNKPVLYVTGGSLGAHELNVHIESILPELVKHFVVIHQTGNVKEFGDFERLSSIKYDNYHIYDHILEQEIGSIFQSADIVVSRSGANTVFELMALRKLSVLVPLPYSGFNEQELQAKLLENNGVAKVFNQSQSSQKLLETIMSVYKNRVEMSKNFAKLKDFVIKDSSIRIIDAILHDS